MIETISPDGLAFSSKEEGGFIAHVYANVIRGTPDPPTAGAGHVLRPGDAARVPCRPPYPPYNSPEWKAHAASCPGIPLVQCSAWLAADMGKVIASVVALSKRCSVVFTQHMFDALCDLGLNAGTATEIPSQSHVALALVDGDVLGAARHMLDWDKTPGGVDAELLGRRWREAAVFLTPDGQPVMSVDEARARLFPPA